VPSARSFKLRKVAMKDLRLGPGHPLAGRGRHAERASYFPKPFGNRGYRGAGPLTGFDQGLPRPGAFEVSNGRSGTMSLHRQKNKCHPPNMGKVAPDCSTASG
jgi:hypothetical protein